MQSSVVLAAQPQTFDAWLQEYHAWDVYEQELSTQPMTEQNILARAGTLLRMEKPDQVIKLLDTSFANQVSEQQRYILRARAQRLLGSYDECIFSWLAFSRMVPRKKYTSVMSKEPGLDLLFKNVWKKWFWESFFTSNAKLDASRRPLMDQMLDLGERMWPQKKFWQQTRPLYTNLSARALSASPSDSTQISPEREYIGKALAYWSLGFWDKGDLLINEIANKQHAHFWHHFSSLLSRASSTEIDLTEGVSAQATSRAFFTLFAPKIRSEAWLLQPPEVSSWTTFAKHLENMEPEQALTTIIQEQSSMFLSEQIKQSLAVCRVVFTLQHEGGLDLEKNRSKLLSAIDSSPLLLRLACLILGGHPDMPSDPQTAALITYLAQASGMKTSRGVLAPFWESTVSAEEYPLDYLMEYVSLAGAMQKKPTYEASIDLAFLFPQSPAAQKGFLFLAGEAHRDGTKKQSWAYLQKIRTKDLDSKDRIEFLLARAGMEMEFGYEDAALKDYAVLMQEDPDSILPEKQLKLALLGQQKHKWSWAQDILEGLWKKRALLDETIRAEILFWLGEGAQSQGKMQDALKYYLRLAWQYPGQNIWAVTAMYRAGLMYEKNGQFETARQLYASVLKNSDRESQKKAVKARIASVSAGLKAQKSSQEPLPLF